MIVFENPGEIDVAAISTFGVSVKEGDSPIGFFGTGLKYALAILLRNRHKVSILSGINRFDFATATTVIRGEQFDVVQMNDQKLGFTTQVGKTWEMWMAYRELYCNARDEHGSSYVSQNFPQAVSGHTFVVVHGAGIEAAHAERSQFFLEDKPDFVVDTMELRDRESVSFFYRGVKVSPTYRKAMLTYNESLKMDLTEDRTVKNAYEVSYRAARALVKLKNIGVIRRVLTAPKDSFEGALDFHGWGLSPSEEFLNVIGELVNDGISNVNDTARKLWEDKRGADFTPRELRLTPVQVRTLDRALDFCGQIGFPIRGAYPISVVESLGKDTLGLAKDGCIYVAERAFQVGGAKQVSATLIEEFAHLRYGYKDCTREMQNWLFEKMVSIGEELVGEPV